MGKQQGRGDDGRMPMQPADEPALWRPEAAEPGRRLRPGRGTPRGLTSSKRPPTGPSSPDLPSKSGPATLDSRPALERPPKRRPRPAHPVRPGIPGGSGDLERAGAQPSASKTRLRHPCRSRWMSRPEKRRTCHPASSSSWSLRAWALSSLWKAAPSHSTSSFRP